MNDEQYCSNKDSERFNGITVAQFRTKRYPSPDGEWDHADIYFESAAFHIEPKFDEIIEDPILSCHCARHSLLSERGIRYDTRESLRNDVMEAIGNPLVGEKKINLKNRFLTFGSCIHGIAVLIVQCSRIIILRLKELMKSIIQMLLGVFMKAVGKKLRRN